MHRDPISLNVSRKTDLFDYTVSCFHIVSSLSLTQIITKCPGFSQGLNKTTFQPGALGIFTPNPALHISHIKPSLLVPKLSISPHNPLASPTSNTITDLPSPLISYKAIVQTMASPIDTPSPSASPARLVTNGTILYEAEVLPSYLDLMFVTYGRLPGLNHTPTNTKRNTERIKKHLHSGFTHIT